MKLKNIFKIILFILISGVLLLSLSGCTKSEIQTVSKMEVDTKYDSTLASIDRILEKNEQHEKADNIIKNVEFNSTSRTLRVFCKENNDKAMLRESANRVADAIRKVNLHRVYF